MTWFAVFESATGRLHSTGEVLADPLPIWLESVVISDKPDETQMWDQNTRSFITRPAKVLVDRLQDILRDPAYTKFQSVWFKLGLLPGEQDKLMDDLIQLLGGERYRNASETNQITPVKDVVVQKVIMGKNRHHP